MKRNVAIGMIGSTSDGPRHESRWGRWRPTLGLVQQADLPLSRIDLLFDLTYESLAEVVAEDVTKVAPNTRVELHKIDFADPNNFESVYEKLYSFAERYPFNELKENYYLHLTTANHAALVSFFLLAKGRFMPGQLIQTSAPIEVLGDNKAGTYSVVDLDFNQYRGLSDHFQSKAYESEEYLKNGVETKNKAYNKLISRIANDAIPSREPILLFGPEGIGKTVLARRIFDLKSRRNLLTGRFIRVIGSAIQGEHGMAQLFGQKGSGRSELDRIGLIGQANLGALFLDEIDQIGLEEQAMLVNAIETGEYTPLGADAPLQSSFQLIAGAQSDLKGLVDQGRIRPDLYNLLNRWTFELPPLRDRKEDIEPNFDHELKIVQKNMNIKLRLSPEARERYLDFATNEAEWPGNFSDLRASISRIATQSDEGNVDLDGVEREIGELHNLWLARPENEELVLIDKWVDRPIDEFERIQLAFVLRICRESKSMSDAGRKLYAISREQKRAANDADRLRKYLQKFGIQWAQIREVRI